MGSLLSLTVMVRTEIFRSEKCRVILDQLWAPYIWLVLDGTKDFVDREAQQGEVLFHPKGSE